MSNVVTYFFPHLRRGLGANTTLVGGNEGKRALVDIKFKVKAEVDKSLQNEVEIKKKVALYGPGDVLGFDAKKMIIRAQPVAQDHNFLANHIPFVEFVEADFLWRYSAAKNDGNWIPWLSLIVLEREDTAKEGEFEYIQNSKPALPPRIKLKEGAILPDLGSSWRWAHVACQEKKGLNRAQVISKIQDNPQIAISRLTCARKLQAGTKYAAFIVPTYLLGVEAALGIMDTATHCGQLAWSESNINANDLIIREGLPYYHHWEFHTGLRGDFEQLIRLLKPRPMGNLNGQKINIDNPGYGFLNQKTPTIRSMELNGVLQTTIPNPAQEVNKNPLTDPETKQLAELLSLVVAKDAAGKPILEADGIPKLRVVPSIYGCWINNNNSEEGIKLNLGTGPNVKAQITNRWLENVNLDLRYRIAAGLGVQYVKEKQEELMQSAWVQLDKIRQANLELLKGRIGREISSRLHTRISQIDNKVLSFSFTTPVHRRLVLNAPVVAIDIDPKAGIPVDPNQLTLPKTNQLSVFTHLKTSNFSNTLTNPKLRKFLVKNIKFPNTSLANDKTMDDFRHEKIITARMSSNRMQDSRRKVIKPIVQPYIILPDGEMAHTQGLILQKLHPAHTIENRLLKRFEALVGLNGPSDAKADKLRPAMAYPKFHVPTYAYLLELSKDYFVPGMEQIPQNTASVLYTNRKFIEAFMLGLNHEFAAELRWRGYPTDMRGSYFRKFWDSTIYSLDTKKDKTGESEADAFRKTTFGEELLKKLAPNTWGDIEAAYKNLSDDRLASAYEAAVEKWLLTREEDKDISELATWGETTKLGMHQNVKQGQNTSNNELVLLLRAEFIRKYPNTLTYLVPPDSSGKNPLLGINDPKIYPVFEAKLPPDILCMGFPVDSLQSQNMYIVFEERVSEHRLGLDNEPNAGEETLKKATESNLSWQHFPEEDDWGYLNNNPPTKASDEILQNWSKGAAYTAKVIVQQPIRVVVPISELVIFLRT